MLAKERNGVGRRRRDKVKVGDWQEEKSKSLVCGMARKSKRD